MPSLGLFDLLFAAPERDRTFALLDGALGERLAADVAERTGFAMLGIWDNGLRHISSIDRALHRPGDCAGLRLRTLVNQNHRRSFAALGFEARAIDIRDLPEAVASRAIDAQENPLTNLYRFALHRTHRVVTLTGHLQGIAPVLFNRASLESWPPRGATRRRRRTRARQSGATPAGRAGRPRLRRRAGRRGGAHGAS